VQRPVGGEQSGQCSPYQRLDRLLRPGKRRQQQDVGQYPVRVGADTAGVAVSHPVPVVGGRLHLGRAVQAHLTQRHQVLESAVGATFEGKELHQLGEIGLIRHQS
jgi:hypothetical protein